MKSKKLARITLITTIVILIVSVVILVYTQKSIEERTNEARNIHKALEKEDY